MILVLAGTTEGREMIAALSALGRRVTAAALTSYGAEIARSAGAGEVLCGGLAEDSLCALLQSRKFKAVVDCTHPFAVTVTETARQACARHGVPYYRCSRPAAELPAHPLVKKVGDWEEAAGAVAALECRNIFLAIGTRRLDLFVNSPLLRQKRLIARVLPEVGSLAACRSLGLPPRDIVAIQGPCGRELNLALYRHCGAEAVVTKEDGTAGGLEDKVSAALELGLPVIIVSRPREDNGMSKEEILAALRTQ
ncbi:MAG: precorrin-6A reductase [Eubacteriales bacterium]